jgi:hypothetical protein
MLPAVHVPWGKVAEIQRYMGHGDGLRVWSRRIESKGGGSHPIIKCQDRQITEYNIVLYIRLGLV